MKFSSSKNQVFGGGLYFSGAVAIVSILGCCEEVCAGINDISDIINLFNNISWRIIANNKIVDADEGNWITEEKYNESIIKVIAQAVADCITDKNEFAFRKEGDVITFDVEVKDYTDENWNAVVLWNYLHVLKWNYLNNSNMSKDEVFEEVRRRICDQYPTKGVKDLEGQLNKAISDIKEYDKELSLADEMKEFYSIARNTKGKSFKEIIQNNPMLAPNADWSMEKSIEKDTGRQHLQKKKNVSEEDIDWVNFESTNLESHNFTPIKIKADNTIYFINMYTFCMPLKSSLGDLECCLYNVSKDKSLKGMSWNSEEWKNSLIPDKSILDTIQTQIQELFKDIIKSKDIRIQ